MRKRFSNVFFRMSRFVIFIKIFKYRYIANFASEDRGAYLLCQRMFQEFVGSLWRNIRGREIVVRSKPKYLRRQTISVRTYLSTVIHREKNQCKKKKEALLYYVISSKNILTYLLLSLVVLFLTTFAYCMMSRGTAPSLDSAPRSGANTIWTT